MPVRQPLSCARDGQAELLSDILGEAAVRELPESVALLRRQDFRVQWFRRGHHVASD